MIKILFGAPGSGKTHYVFERLSEDYENSILIVPEQQTVICERLSLEHLPSKAQLSFEVLNFSRLCNRYFRKFGGLSYNYISPAMKSLFMWRTLRSVELCEYKAEGNELSLTPIMLSTVSQLKSSGISSAELREVAEKLTDTSPLKSKLTDIAEIGETYDELVAGSFDDASNDLYKLCEIADKHKIFKGKKIYVDSFSSFTAPELAIIKRIFSQADEVTVTLGCESPKQNLICNESLKSTAAALGEIADGLGKRIGFDFLTEIHRTESPELRAVNTSLWSMGSIAPVSDSIPDEARGDLRIISCKNAYSEADAVVGIIKDQIERGLRYRDIAVIARDISTRRGILDAALENADIPYFMSRSSDLAARPAIRLVTSALRTKIYGFRSEDVLANLNTGLYAIDSRDAALFSEYVNTWSITGKRFLDEGWSMNPDGYTDRITERGKKILAAANSVRSELIGKLERLFIEIDVAETAQGICRAIYNYFESISLRERLTELAQNELSRKRAREAADIHAVYNLMISVLDDIASALPDQKLRTDEFLQVFSLAVSSAAIGAIPTKYDEVTLGSASLLRTDGIKCAILIGVNDGEFPRSVHDEGIFSISDRQDLLKHGIKVDSDQRERTSEEFLFARRAMSAPSERLYMLYCRSNVTGKVMQPSLLVKRTRDLLDYIEIEEYEKLDPILSLGSYSAAVNLLPELGRGDAAVALSELLTEQGKISANRRIADPSARIDKETAATFFGDNMHLSQTQIDKFVHCSFRYCCENILSLRPSKKAEVGHDIAGTFVHSLLEEFLRLAVDGDTIDLSFPEEKTEEAVDSIIEGLIDKICPPDKKGSSRMSHVFLKLRKLSLLVIRNLRDEFAHSSFTPSYFELSIGKSRRAEQMCVEPLVFELEDGSKVTLTGQIDRVDVMKKDGNVYIRVIDYKTGSKEFSVSDIKNGINLQLLIYIFTLCRKNTAFAAEVGCEDGTAPIAVAAHYLSSRVPTKKLELPRDSEDTLRETASSLSRSGIYKNDPELLSALNSELDKNMLGGISLDKNGIFQGNGLLAPSEFDGLITELESTVLRIAGEMRSGRADAAPLSPELPPYCDYCDMKAVCRSARRSSY